MCEWLPEAEALYRQVESAAGQGGDLNAALLARASPDGVDVGDHPPITPVKLATGPRQCEGEAGWALYQYICRRFVASLSDDCLFETAKLRVSLGEETFEASATRCTQRGWAGALGVRVAGDGPGPAGEATRRPSARCPRWRRAAGCSSRAARRRRLGGRSRRRTCPRRSCSA